MIRFDSDPGTPPKGWQLAGNPQKALIVHDDDVWQDYILGGELAEQYPVTNTMGRTLDGLRMVKDQNGEAILCTGPSGTGGAEAGMLLELLIASGIKQIVAFGTCGGLAPDLRRNTIIIPTAAFRDEGLSYHYLPDGEEVAQDSKHIQLMEKVFSETALPFATGKVWTTDAIYRETAGKIKFFSEHSAIGVDMELASCLAVAQFRQFAGFCQFLIADDNIADQDWRQRDDALPRDSKTIFEAALAILNQL